LNPVYFRSSMLLPLFRVENHVYLSRGVPIAGATWQAVTRIVVRVGDLVQKTRDDQTQIGYSMVRRSGGRLIFFLSQLPAASTCLCCMSWVQSIVPNLKSLMARMRWCSRIRSPLVSSTVKNTDSMFFSSLSFLRGVALSDS
jgi:hypothetical protein